MVKVKDTKPQKMIQGNPDFRAKIVEIQVAEGKLVLIKATSDTLPGDVYVKSVGYHPIIISLTEKIEVGDWYYSSKNDSKYQIQKNDPEAIGLKKEDAIDELYAKSHKMYKILALPEHFSPQQLQDIVDDKLKDGDKVLVECQSSGTCKCNVIPKGIKGCDFCPNYDKDYVIKLNSSNHITLHKVEEKMYTREELHTFLELALATASAYGNDTDSKDFESWFEQNVK